MSQIKSSEVILMGLALLVLFSFIIYYLTLNALQTKDLQVVLKIIPLTTLILVLTSHFAPNFFISYLLLHFLCLISLPILVCFFIFSQKSFNVIFYGAMLGAIAAIDYLNFNSFKQNLMAGSILFLYIGIIVTLKIKLKNKIIQEHKFYMGLVFIPISFLIVINAISPLTFLTYPQLPLAQQSFLKIIDYVDTHLLLTFAFGITLLLPFLVYCIEIIREADCFSEKIFAGLALPLLLSTVLVISKIRLWNELVLILIFIAFLAGVISKQYYYILKNNKNVLIKTKKNTELKGVPSFILSALLMAGSIWYFVVANK